MFISAIGIGIGMGVIDIVLVLGPRVDLIIGQDLVHVLDLTGNFYIIDDADTSAYVSLVSVLVDVHDRTFFFCFPCMVIIVFPG